MFFVSHADAMELLVRFPWATLRPAAVLAVARLGLQCVLPKAIACRSTLLLFPAFVFPGCALAAEGHLLAADKTDIGVAVAGQPVAGMHDTEGALCRGCNVRIPWHCSYGT